MPPNPYRTLHHVDGKRLVEFPAFLLEALRDIWKYPNRGFFYSGEYDETELKYVQEEEDCTIHPPFELLDEVRAVLEKGAEPNPEGLLEFYADRWNCNKHDLAEICEAYYLYVQPFGDEIGSYTLWDAKRAARRVLEQAISEGHTNVAVLVNRREKFFPGSMAGTTVWSCGTEDTTNH